MEIDESNFISIELLPEYFYEGIEVAKETEYIDNRRRRTDAQRFLDNAKGYAVEKGVEKFNSNYFIVYRTEYENGEIRSINGRNVDMKISSSGTRWGNIEIKSSLLSQPSILEQANQYSMQLTAGGMANPDVPQYDLGMDVYMQFYYDIQIKNERSLVSSLLNKYPNKETIRKAPIEELYEDFRMYDYLDKCYFIGWEFRDTILGYLNELPTDNRLIILGNYNKCWNYPVKKAKSPHQFIQMFGAKNYIEKILGGKAT